MSGYAWIPPAEWVESAHATAFARWLGTDGYRELLALSTAEPERFWDAVALDLGIPFETPYEHVLDVSDGPAWARWFTGGRLNLAHACVERWADDPAHAGVEAIVAEDEEGATRSLTYAELAREVARCAEGLEALGVRSGDAVALLMPMAPEVVDRATTPWPRSARSSCRSSRASRPAAVASRLEDSRAVALITVDAFCARGRPVAAKATADEAVARSPGVRTSSWCATPAQPVAWHGRAATSGGTSSSRAGPGRGARRRSTSEHPFMLAYTSGTTGRPKGAVHVHGGLPRQDRDARAATRRSPARRRVHWMTDIGWIMGPWLLGQRPRPGPDGAALRRRARLPGRPAASGASPSATA